MCSSSHGGVSSGHAGMSSAEDGAPFRPSESGRVDSLAGTVLDSSTSIESCQTRVRLGLVISSLALVFACSGPRTDFAAASGAADTKPTAPSHASTLGSAALNREALDRAESIRRLGGDAPGDLDRLVASLDDPDQLVRGTAAAVLLARVDPALTRQALASHASKGNLANATPERKLLEYSLVSADFPNIAGQSICDRAGAERGALERSKAVFACIRFGDPSSDTLLRLADDSHWAVRTRLAIALGTRDADGHFGAVAERLLQDPHPTVREAASRLDAPSCGRHGSETSDVNTISR